VAFRSPTPHARFSGGCLTRFRIRAGTDVSQEVVIREPMLTLEQSFQVAGQFSRTKSRPFLDADPVLQKERKVGCYDIPNRRGALLNAVESIDSKSFGLIEPHVP